MTISTLTKAGRRAAIIFLKHHGDIIDCKFAVPEKTFDVTKRSKLEDLLEELEENGDIAEGIAELILQTV